MHVDIDEISVIASYNILGNSKVTNIQNISIKDVFLNKGNCATCHMLSEANSVGQIGPNLDQINLELIRISNAVSMGIGVMPAFEGMLTDKEIESVSYYVFESTNK